MPLPPPRMTREERAELLRRQRFAAQAVRDELERLGISQAAIAAALGVHESQLSRWLNGRLRWPDGPEDMRETFLEAVRRLEAVA